MVFVRLGLLKGFGTTLLVLSCLHTASSLFDSVWVDAEAADDIAVLYRVERQDEPRNDDAQENIISDLWHLFFPDSSGFRSAVDIEPETTGYPRANAQKREISPFSGSTDNGKRKKRQKHTDYNFVIPPGYILEMDWPEDEQTSEEVTKMKELIADVLMIPKNHVHVYTNEDRDGKLSWYFVKPKSNPDSTDPNDLISVTEALGELKPENLENWNIDAEDNSVQPRVQESSYVRSYSRSLLVEPYFALAILALSIVVVAVIVLVVCCCIRRKDASKKPEQIPTAESALLATVPHQICLYPAAKPNINSGTAVQPPDSTIVPADMSQILASRVLNGCGTPVRGSATPLSGGSGTPLSGSVGPGTPLSGSGSPVYSSSSQSGTPIPGTPVHTPPLRMKSRGLLERRGSNASLTLELGPGPTDTLQMGSPPKESTVEEYLMAAGNPMSRRQLRRTVENVKSLHEEFWEIPMNHPEKNMTPGSGMKNRYRTIIPNEATRVILPEIEGDNLSSYINANYMRGYSSEAHSFIATQGPMANTINDFWRMIWQEKSTIIVMITKLKEKNKNKCESYVPDYHDTFGEIDVMVEEITEQEGCIIRKLRLRHCGEEHTLLHYWYMAWPDHKAPNTARQLLSLVKQVDKRSRDPVTGQTIAPVIVHCSAGIGRTGCFIGASIGMRQLREESIVDVQGIVCNMRLDRGGMVQTNEQYEFIHQTLVLYEQELPPSSGD